MITSVSCSACGRGQNAPTSRAGQEVPCRFCGESILVPGSAAPRSAIGGWRNVEPPKPPPVQFERSRPSGQPELVEEKRWTTETSSVELRAEVESGDFDPSSPLERASALFARFGEGEGADRVVSSSSESFYQSNSRVEVDAEGRVRTTRSESGHGPGGEPFRARYESVEGPDGEFSESSHESGQRPPGFAEAPVFDRARRREADAGRRHVGSPVGAPVTDSRQAREAKAGRPIVSSGSQGYAPQGVLGLVSGLNSESESERSASVALVLAILGWAFCFPISLVALYKVHESKKHALAENRPLPQVATIATVTALLNLGFMGLTCLGNL